METKEPIKIKLSTVISIFIIIVLIAVITYLIIRMNLMQNNHQKEIIDLQNNFASVLDKINQEENSENAAKNTSNNSVSNTSKNTTNTNSSNQSSSQNNSKNEITGTFSFSKKLSDDATLTCSITLNSDGTASYSLSDGSSFEMTRGKYSISGNALLYQREYYNYESGETNAYDGEDKNLSFTIINSSTLKQNAKYGDETITLIKQK